MAEDVSAGKNSGISAEDQARIARIKRRNMILALIAGIAMLILGFLAGHNAKVQRSAPPANAPAALVLSIAEIGAQAR